jgi:hypothetical protein
MSSVSSLLFICEMDDNPSISCRLLIEFAFALFELLFPAILDIVLIIRPNATSYIDTL